MTTEILRPELLAETAFLGTLFVLCLKSWQKKRLKQRDGIAPEDYKKYNIHHIEFKSNGGQDHPDNLISLLKTYHTQIHQNGEAERLKNKFRHKVRENTIQAQLFGWVYQK